MCRTSGYFRAPLLGGGNDALFVEARQAAFFEQRFAGDPEVFDAVP